jgi:hypothetical protein
MTQVMSQKGPLQIDFFPPDTVPGEGTKYVVRKHMNVLVQGIMKDI